MMSTDDIPTKPVTGDDDNGRKTVLQQALKCPRCDSPNTKFCYYNNYSLTQPRHFCKTCRRYWTKGGALRNVPIGGGCRKNKRTKSAASSKDSSGGLELFQGLSPATEFQLGGISSGGGLSLSRFHSSPTSIYGGDLLSSAAGTATNFDAAATASSESLMGFHFSGYPIGDGGFKSESGMMREMGSMNFHSNSVASSIESLSCINQDLHWKLQQQRLAAMLFGGETQHKDGGVGGGGGGVSGLPAVLENQMTKTVQKPQPISFQNLGISKQEVLAVSNPTNMKSGMRSDSGGATTTEWFFDNSYTPTATTTTTTIATNNNSGSHENDNTSNWNGFQAWTDLHQYSILP